jgi:tetraacyldisaccharide 4'-kinase
VSITARAEALLTSAWQRRGPLAWSLAPLALLFGLVVAVRRAAYAARLLTATRLAVPVIVIGNLYVGGTGKTPLTIELVRALQRRGWTPGVISRGHGGAEVVRCVSNASSAAEVGDEPLLIARATAAPVAVGRSRVAAGRTLLQKQPSCDVLIADDGLQHLRLARDVEIAVVDERQLGNGWLLPAGPLREPGRRLRSVDAIVLHQATRPPVAGVACFALSSGIAVEFRQLSDPGKFMSLQHLVQRQRQEGLKITAAAGIGVPQRFFDMLRAAGLEVEPLPLPDHYGFQDNPFASSRAEVVLITEKDAVKCERIAALRDDPRLWVVPLHASIDAALVDFVVARLTSLPRGPHGSSVT